METLAVSMRHMQMFSLLVRAVSSTKIIPSHPSPLKATITFASNFEQNVGWRAVLVKQIDLFCF